MREIKFRAWYRDRKVMTDGFSLGNLLKTANSQDEISFMMAQQYSEIMQFTGLHDKNGKEIYEGDWVRFRTRGGNEMIYDVKWSDFKTGFKPSRLTYNNHEEIEVIGNIYQNPELLK